MLPPSPLANRRDVYLVPLDELRVPDMEEEPLRPERINELVADLPVRGQQEPIVLIGRIVVNGRHRVLALRELGEKQVWATEARLPG